MIKLNTNFYKNFSKVYDNCQASDYSVFMGEIVLHFFNEYHSGETFKSNIDLCCGTGELCKFFTENGVKSKGVDISHEMLEIACDKYPDIEFIEADITKYADNEMYDFATCFNDSINHICDVESLKSAIKNIGTLLRKGGYFIFDVNNFNFIQFKKYTALAKDDMELTYHFQRSDKFITCDIEYIKDGKVMWVEKAYEREYTVDELARILNDSGFIIEICSQHFFEEHELIKWKFITKKIF